VEHGFFKAAEANEFDAENLLGFSSRGVGKLRWTLKHERRVAISPNAFWVVGFRGFFFFCGDGGVMLGMGTTDEAVRQWWPI